MSHTAQRFSWKIKHSEQLLATGLTKWPLSRVADLRQAKRQLRSRQVHTNPGQNRALRLGQKSINPTTRNYFAVASNSRSVQTHATPHSKRKPCRLTLRSTGQFAAFRLWASFHSRPNPACRKLPVSSNVRHQNRRRWRAGRKCACRRELNSHEGPSPDSRTRVAQSHRAAEPCKQRAACFQSDST